MKKKVFKLHQNDLVVALILTLFVTVISYSQDSFEKKLKQIETIYKREFWGDKPENIFYNKMENIVDISIYQIPLDIVNISYVFDKSENAHIIDFACHEDRACLGERIFQMKMRMKSKSGCYEFINALTDLNQVWLSQQ